MTSSLLLLQLQNYLVEVEALCKEVGAFQMQHWQTVKSVDIADKGLNQLVSFVDKESEQKLMDGLSAILPGSCFIGEEYNPDSVLGDEPTWIIDPLDGTTNFLHGLPVFAVSVALWDAGSAQLGVVHAPAMQETFTAVRGGGAYLNGKVLQLTGELNLSQSLIATGFPYYDFEKMSPYLELLSDLMRSTHGLRRMGSAAIDLAYMAAGRFDAFYEMGLAPWDVAAGVLLVEEAGGFVSNFTGGPSVLFKREIIAAHPALAKEFLQRVSDKLA
jgi:myo-inositol-1(or 4)-monophosphatase